MQNNKLIWVIVALVIIIAGVFFAWSKNLIPGLKEQESSTTGLSMRSESQNNQYQVNNPDTTQDSAPAEDGINVNLEGEETDPPEGKRSNEKPDEVLRQQIITYFNQNLNKLAAPPANDKWDIPTFYFVGNSIVYLELYAENTELTGQELLYKVEKEGNGFKLTRLAKKTEGEEDWTLVEGKDEYSDYVMEEYDLNEENNKWEKTDEFTEESYLEEDIDLSEESGSEQILP